MSDLHLSGQNRKEVVNRISEGINAIRESVANMYEGLNEILNNKLYDGKLNIREGNHGVIKGMGSIIDGLREIRFEINPDDIREIYTGITNIHDGIRDVNDMMFDILHGTAEEDINLELLDGIERIDEGLMGIIEGFRDVLEENFPA